MSFRSFTTAISFFDHLVARYNAELPPDPTEDDIMYFRRVKIPVQKRVIHVLKRWTMHHWHDFGKLSQLKSDLEEFTESCEYINDVQELRNIMEEQVWIDVCSFNHLTLLKPFLKKYSKQTKYEALINSVSITPSRKKGRESLLLEFTVDDVSAQMCLHNFNLFKQIHPIEFLDQIWGKPGDENSATPSLNFFIARFDQESYWVATEILMQKDMKKRVQVLSNMILIAKVLLEEV